MKLEVSYLQLAVWLVRGVAVFLSCWRIDKCNNLTLQPILRAKVS
jgi:hypothetical protein